MAVYAAFGEDLCLLTTVNNLNILPTGATEALLAFALSFTFL